MNAKMVITVPMDKVPDEITRIIENIVERLKNITQQTSDCTYNNDHNLVIEQIDNIRKELALVDLNLEDCYTVLLGYVKYITDKRLNNTHKQQEQSDGSDIK